KDSPIKVIPDTTVEKPFSELVHIHIVSNQKFKLKIGDSKNWTEEFFFGIPIRKYNLNLTVLNNSPNTSTNASNNEGLYFIVNDIVNLTSAYKGKIMVNKFYKEATLLEMSSVGTVPQKEIDFLNQLAEVYIQNSLDEKNLIGNNAI